MNNRLRITFHIYSGSKSACTKFAILHHHVTAEALTGQTKHLCRHSVEGLFQHKSI